MHARFLGFAFLLLATACGETGPLVEDASPTPTRTDEPVPGLAATRSQGGKARAQVTGAGAQRLSGISGQVTNESGEPIEGICIDVHDREGDGLDQTHLGVVTTDEKGRYFVPADIQLPSVPEHERETPVALRFRDCRPEPRYAFEWHDGGVSMPRGSIRLLADRNQIFNAQLQLGGSISGRAIDQKGDAAAGVCALFFDDTPYGSFEQAPDHEPFAGITLGRKGTYRLGGLAAKTYRVAFINGARWGGGFHMSRCGEVAPQWYEETFYGGARYQDRDRPEWPRWPEDATAISLQAREDRSGVDIVLERGASIAGRVVAKGCYYLQVGLYSAGKPVPIGDPTPIAQFQALDSGDSFVFGGIQPGDYKVSFGASELSDRGGYDHAFDDCVEWFNERPSIDKAHTVRVEPLQRTGGVNAHLEPGA